MRSTSSPLLTAIGNGRGGGDYHDEYPNFDIVGSWAMNEIYFTYSLPTKDVIIASNFDYEFNEA